MRKIKTIFAGEAEAFDNKVNQALEELKGAVIDIKFSTDFAIEEGDKDAYFNAMIIYEE